MIFFLRALIRQLPPRVEFLIVIAACFGQSILLSLWWLGGEVTQVVTFTFDNASVRYLVITELVALLLVAAFLLERGWKLDDGSFKISWALSGVGLGLFVATYLLYGMFYAFASAMVGSDRFDHVEFTSEISFFWLLALCVVNSIFEEVIVVSYVIRALESQHGLVFAIGASAAVRLSYHLYQGPVAVVAILPMGILFASYYGYRRCLWPLVLSHGVTDLLALWMIA